MRLAALGVVLIGLLVGLMASAGTERAQTFDAEIIVSRTETTVEVYWSSDLEQLARVFGPIQRAIPDLRLIATDAERAEGTFDTADVLFAGLGLSASGRDVGLEAMSMMLHAPGVLTAFDTPYDALLAIEVCNAPGELQHYSDGDLRAVAGFFADDLDAQSPIALTLPETGRTAVQIRIKDFDQGRLVGTRVVTVADAGTLRLDDAS